MRDMITERDKLLNDLAQFQAISGLSDTRIGELALSDPNWVFRFRDGADPKLGTVDRVRKFMREWRPAPPRPSQRADRARFVA